MCYSGLNRRTISLKKSVPTIRSSFVSLAPTHNKKYKLFCLGIDTHLAWCGRCDSMEQNYRSLHMRFDEDYLRMEFFSASEEHIPEEIMSGLTHGPLTCRPRFLVFCEGEKKDEIDGADYTRLELSVGKYIPSHDE